MKPCVVPGCTCNRPRRTRGMCDMHYMRLLRHGDAMAQPVPANVARATHPKRHPLYGAWAAMINRCHNPNNSSFQRYGGRGVFVCAGWRESFWNFLADVGERPAGKTLDRIDPEGPYAPDNCRWATPAEQRRNRSAAAVDRHRLAMVEYWKTDAPNAVARARRRLTEAQVADIRTGSDGHAALARKYGVSPTSIVQIKNRTTYRDLP